MRDRDVKRTVLVASILGSGIVFLDQTVVNVALPAIRSSLHGSLADQQWVVEAYLLTLSSLLLLGGSLGDVLGRKRVFTTGLLGFGACSLACALAPSSPVLIAARGLQGVAGALLVPSTLALIVDHFGARERAAAIGTWTAWTGVATVIGPLGGGALVQAASWRWIFIINVIPVAITVALLRRLPADERMTANVDWIGGLLCVLGLGGPVFGLIEQSRYGFGDPRVAIPILAGLILLVAFVVWERHTPEPMLPLHLFAIRNFAVGNLTTLSVYGGLSVATFFTVVFLQQVGGYTPIAAGLSLLPITLLMFTLSPRFGALADQVGPRPFMSGGPLLAGAGFLLFARAGADPSYVTVILPGVLVFGLGLAATVAPLTATVLGSVPTGHSGLASGTNNAMSRIAGLLAIAAVGAAVSAAFVSQIGNSRALSPQVRSEIRTQPLVTSAPGLPPRDHEILVNASVHAFRVGMEIAAALAVLGGVIALIGIENTHTGDRFSGALADPAPFVAVVTGASSGIGEATARRLSREPGARLVLVARRRDRLETLAGQLGGATVVAVDLTDPAAASAVREAIENNHAGDLHLLVNNAGARWAGSFADTGWANVDRHMRINFEAPLRLTEALLPLLRATAAKTPQPVSIVNVSSTSGRVARGNAGGYSAAKFALAGWSDSLAAEERPNGVHVGLVLPGFIATEGFPQAELVAHPLLRRIVSRPEVVAEAIVDCGRGGAVERYAPRPYAIAAAARILLPGLVRRAISAETLTPATRSDAPD